MRRPSPHPAPFLVLLFLAGDLASSEPPTWRLDEEWRVDLGPAARRALLRAAVCPDGAVYLAVSPRQGDETRLVAEVGPRHGVRCELAVCGGRGGWARHVPASPGGDLGPSLARLEAGAYEMALGQDGSLFVLSDGFGSRFIHRVSPEGRVLSSLGEDLDRRSGIMGGGRLPSGSLIVVGSRVLFFPGNRYELQAYDPDGPLVDLRRYDEPESRPRHWRAALSAAVPGDRVRRAAALPGGRILVQVARHWAGSSLDVLDESHELLATGVAAEGLMQGADESGGIYFTSVRARRFEGTLSKARLLESRAQAPAAARRSPTPRGRP